MGIELLVERLVLVRLTQLDRQRSTGCEVGRLAQNGELLVDVPDVFVFRHQLLDQRMGSFAVTAVVIEKLYNGQRRLRIPHLGILIGIKLLGVSLDQRLVTLGLLALLLGTQGIGHLDQDLGILDQIVANDLLDIAFGQLACMYRRRQQGHTSQRAKQGIFNSHNVILQRI